jgi:hypothetical protein
MQKASQFVGDTKPIRRIRIQDTPTSDLADFSFSPGEITSSSGNIKLNGNTIIQSLSYEIERLYLEDTFVSPNTTTSTTYIHLSNTSLSGELSKPTTDGFIKNIILAENQQDVVYTLDILIDEMDSPNGYTDSKKIILDTVGMGIGLIWDNIIEKWSVRWANCCLVESSFVPF